MKRWCRWLAISVAMIVIVLGFVTLASLMTHTRYAPGFTDKGFENISAGSRAEEVIAVLGQPLSHRTERSPDRWCYGEAPPVADVEEKRVWLLWSTHRFKLPVGPPCLVFDEKETVREVVRDREGRFRAIAGRTKPDVLLAVGPPQYKEPARVSTVLFYSELDGDDGSYEVRSVVIDENGRVVESVAYTLWD